MQKVEWSWGFKLQEEQLRSLMADGALDYVKFHYAKERYYKEKAEKEQLDSKSEI
ncbi:hypothetical protein AABF64_002091 [Acinetobacter baumannii]|jgi:hypothetical protein|uniref:hypothetical protein n=1 Tax=Acinetobacter TaxID=469 RepID=UPI0002CFE863|nr:MULTISPECIES: hypothetical protein [Acinetobacter]ALY01442.1 hypothetical protein KBNAB1_3937 [Acinetobacter baumannii]EKT9248040.1 hypothetical protein [Acinetobacter baumannii]EKV8039635.1 hypothetical protein [Acinetobacter baumannii]EKW1488009.1 hypothetical protein [Acinetobacter baumannii]ENV65153.1 hypothetical protein F949_00052 [Acinetobacter junii NIPH 182]